jgi:hypothetical protein
MISDSIVISAIVFGAAFFLAWLVRPDLRVWIERPKYRFQANLQEYDHARREGKNPHE